MDDSMKEIRSIEDRYGIMVFGMGLIQVMNEGHSNITASYVDESIAQIAVQGKTSIMSPEFQCEIIRCAGELVRYSPMTLFRYVKKYMHIPD